jgi:hypothetical protein
LSVPVRLLCSGWSNKACVSSLDRALGYRWSSRRLIGKRADGWSQQEPTVDPNIHMDEWQSVVKKMHFFVQLHVYYVLLAFLWQMDQHASILWWFKTSPYFLPVCFSEFENPVSSFFSFLFFG